MKRGISIALLVGVAAAFAYWLLREVPPPSPPAPVSEWAGSQSCQSCHPEAFAAWAGSAHFHNMARPSPDSIISDFSGTQVYEYGGTRSRMLREGAAYFIEHRDRSGKEARYRVDWVLGVRRHQTYLHAREDGRLQVLPTYWNAEEGRWRDASEGVLFDSAPAAVTQRDHWQNYGRTWNLNCLECHASQGRKGYDAQSNRYDSHFDPAINCESCHGPGGEHVQRWRALKGQVRADRKDTLERLGDYELNAALELCATCHAAKRTYDPDFRPGESFYDHFMPDVWEAGRFYADGRSRTLNYRFVDYLQNGCSPEATQRMDCGHCHEAHALSSVEGKTTAQANAICTGCHLDIKTALAEHTHHGPESEGSRCVECHMPPMDLKLRMTVRDHSISSPLPELTRRFAVPNACQNCHGDRDVAWAEQQVDTWYGAAASFKAYRERMVARAEVLHAAFGGGPKPVDALLRWLDDSARSTLERASAASLLQGTQPNPDVLAALLRHAGDPHPLVRFHVISTLGEFADPRADAALAVALNDARLPVRIRAYEAFSLRPPQIQAQAGPALKRAAAEAARWAAEVVADDPRTHPPRAMAHFREGRPKEAEAALRQAITIAPVDPEFRVHLAGYLLALGRPGEAEVVAREALALDENAHMARVMLGSASLRIGRPNAAQAQLDALNAAAKKAGHPIPEAAALRIELDRYRASQGPPP